MMKLKCFFLILLLIYVKSQSVVSGTLDDIKNHTIIKNITEKYLDSVELKIGFWKTFIDSFLLIFISEIGDKTFILLLFFTAKSNKKTIIFAALIALLLMNFFSIFLGYAVEMLLYKNIIEWLSSFIFIFYGFILISDGWHLHTKTFEVKYIAQLKDEIKKNKHLMIRKKTDMESPLIDREKEESEMKDFIDEEEDENAMSPRPIRLFSDAQLSSNEDNNNIDKEEGENNLNLLWSFISTLILAECGDRTQVATMLCAVAFNVPGVIAGTSLAIILDIMVAVFAGHYIAKYLTEKHMNYVSGIIFLFFGVQIFLLKIRYI